MMKITIDGKRIELEDKKTVLDAARENGITIPSLCDHPRLSPFGGCRLCIVQIKGWRGYPPSCCTYAEEGMEVMTKTPRLQQLRREILELILSEHPNACLICSEKKNCDEFKSTIRKVGEATGCVLCLNNGRCELQNVVDALKVEKVRFPSVYRELEIKKGDPFFDRNYNLCILCGRCVRVCHEVRGASTLSFVYRGSEEVVGTVLDRPHLESGCQFCGACVDVCPTGALSERALKYESLPENTATTICPLCSMGCELEVELKQGRILSSNPSQHGAVNRGQVCVKGRFVIRDLVYSPRRILQPMIRVNKELEEVTWEDALDFVAQKLKKYKGKDVALVTSSQITCEDSFILQKFSKEVLKTENRVSPVGFSALSAYSGLCQEQGLHASLNFRIEEISKANTLFLAGTDLPVTHPIIWLEVLKAVRAGAELVVMNPHELSLNRYASMWLQNKPGTESTLLSYLAKALLENDEDGDYSRREGFGSFKKSLDDHDFSLTHKTTGVQKEGLMKTAELFKEGETAVFLFGMDLAQSPSGIQNLSALWNLALLRNAQVFPLGQENNLRGVFEINKAHTGKDISFDQFFHETLAGKLKALYLAGPMPDLQKAKIEFLVIQDSFTSENIKKADAVLPAATFAETDGTFVNAEGRIQEFKKVVEPLGEARPDWWVVSRLAQKMGAQDFNPKNNSAILKELNKEIPGFSKASNAKLDNEEELFIHEDGKGKKKFLPSRRVPAPGGTSQKYPLLMSIDYNLDYYRNLSLTQESKGLRMLRDSRWIVISPGDAKKLKLSDDDIAWIESSSGKTKSLVKISDAVPKGMVRANFLWSEDSDFSVIPLGFSPSYKNHLLNLIPVKIKRGK
jgi:predicted molibdopterin-dependent oxidoreductase YjgC